MSYFNDFTILSRHIKINGVEMPETSEPVKITFNNVSDGGRLADSIDYEGELKGVKVNIVLKYAVLNKESYDRIFNATQGAYLNKSGFFMSIEVPTYTALGVQKYTGYFMSSHTPNCTETTQKLFKETGNAAYDIGGALYDELHEDVEFSFVQR